MIDFTQPITQFFKANFTPASEDLATHKLSSRQLLEILFNVFPDECIDDYDLNDILMNLGYMPTKLSSSLIKDDPSEIEKQSIKIVWCLKEFNK